MRFLCSPRCPGRRGVRVPVLRGNAECHHLLFGAARSVRQPLSRATPKIVFNQTPYKSHTKIKCSNVVRVEAKR